MVEIKLIEGDDIKKLTELCGYFFEGNVGFLKRYSLPEYGFEYQANTSMALGILIEKVQVSEGELFKLKHFVINDMEKIREGIVEKEKAIAESKKLLLIREEALKKINQSKNLKEAIFELLKK